jgi:hypothetical protein
MLEIYHLNKIYLLLSLMFNNAYPKIKGLINQMVLQKKKEIQNQTTNKIGSKTKCRSGNSKPSAPS